MISERTVEMLPKRLTVKGPAAMLTADVWVDMIAHGERPSEDLADVEPGLGTEWGDHLTTNTPADMPPPATRKEEPCRTARI